MKYKHENILVGNIKKLEKAGRIGSAEHKAFTALHKKYVKYRKEMEAISYTLKNPSDFDKAAKLINDYLENVVKVAVKYDKYSRKEVFSSALEELSLYMFVQNPHITSGEYSLFSGEQIYTGLYVIKGKQFGITSKAVDFCIGRENTIVLEKTEKKVKFPVVCVEVKTYFDSTMAGEVYDSGRRIKTASPGVKTFVLSEFEDSRSEEKKIVGEDALDYFFNLRDMKRLDEKRTPKSVLTPINPKHLLSYYEAVENLL